MITFYPEKIPLWEKTGMFDWNPTITLITGEKRNYMVFRTRDELIKFCKDCGVALNNPKFPLQITGPHDSKRKYGPPVYEVRSEFTLGWIEDDYK